MSARGTNDSKDNKSSMFEDLSALLAGSRSASAPCACRDGRKIAFGEFRALAAGWRRTFAAHPGLRFALYFEDTVEFAAALLGLWHAGKIAYLPGDALPTTMARLAARVDGVAGDVAALQQPLRRGEAHANEHWQPLDPQAPQLVLFTSGTTGEPVAIPKRLSQMFAEVRALEQAFGERVGAVQVLATVSHQHIYGLLFRVLWPLAGGRVLHAERLSYLEHLQPQLAATGAAVLIASPAHLKRLPGLNLQCQALRAVFSSGGPLPDEAVPACLERLGQAPIEVYGSSETGGVAWRQREFAGPGRWLALPGVQWRLRDETLEIRSPHLDSGAWTATADRAAAAEDGGFSLLGRADRVVKIEEKRVSLAAVEQALLGSPWLQELRVISLPGSREQLAVVAVPNTEGWALHDQIGKAAFGARLRGLLLQGLDVVSMPRRWRFVSALPNNAQGKTTRDALLALFDPRRPQPRVLGASASSASLRIAVEAVQLQFDGHFPGQPVLPGVVQLEWALLLGRELFALPASFLGLEGLKFQQVIVPGTILNLQLDLLTPSKLSFKYSSAHGLHASGRILFGDAV